MSQPTRNIAEQLLQSAIAREVNLKLMEVRDSFKDWVIDQSGPEREAANVMLFQMLQKATETFFHQRKGDRF